MVFSDTGTAYGVGIGIGVGCAIVVIAIAACWCRSRRRTAPAPAAEPEAREADARDPQDYRRQQSATNTAQSTQELDDVEFEFQRVQSQRRAPGLAQVKVVTAGQPLPKVTLEVIQADPELEGSLKDVQAEQLGGTVSAFDTTVNNLDGTISNT